MNLEAEALREFFSSATGVLVLLFASALGSAWKQMIVARRANEPGFSVSGYFIKNWPETVTTLGLMASAWVTMILTNSLNPIYALGAGYMANDLSDLVTGKGRSSTFFPPDTKK